MGNVHNFLIRSTTIFHSGTVFSLYDVIKTKVMKKIVQCFMVASVFVACNSKSDLDTSKNVILTDTTGMYRSNILTDTGSVIQTTRLTKGNTTTAVANRPTTSNNTRNTTTRTVPRNNRTRTVYNNSNNNTSTGSGQTTTVTRRRKGWSHAAKDATIGGVGGAVTGAIISKNKGKGAVIGGVLGAAGGYILGRSKDKKEGRY